MKLSLPSRLLREALTDAPSGEYIDKLLEKINADAEQTNQALMNNLTYADNLNAAIVKYRFTHGAELKIPNPLKTRPVGMKVIRSAAINGGTRYAVAGEPDWRFIDGTDPRDKQQLGVTIGYELNHTQPYARFRKSANQAIANSSAQNVTWDVADVSDSSGVISVTSGSRLIVSEPGRYLVTATVVFAFNGAGNRGAFIKQNGASGANSRVGHVLTAAPLATNFWAGNVSQTVSLSANGYVEIEAYQIGGGATLDIQGDQTNECSVAVARLRNNTLPQNEVTLLVIGG